MFICESCLKQFNNFGMFQSYGRCEICKLKADCYDIPSKYLEPKNKDKG